MALRLIDVIEWADQGPGDMVQRVPEVGQGDIRLGSQLIVRPSQQAFFVREGKPTDGFTEGRHTLNTYNLPILTGLLGLEYPDGVRRVVSVKSKSRRPTRRARFHSTRAPSLLSRSMSCSRSD